MGYCITHYNSFHLFYSPHSKSGWAESHGIGCDMVKNPTTLTNPDQKHTQGGRASGARGRAGCSIQSRQQKVAFLSVVPVARAVQVLVVKIMATNSAFTAPWLFIKLLAKRWQQQLISIATAEREETCLAGFRWRPCAKAAINLHLSLLPMQGNL